MQVGVGSASTAAESSPSNQPRRGRIVCNCLDVAENEIIEDVAAGADLATLQAKRKCGTQCGSCMPELKRLVREHAVHSMQHIGEAS